MIEYLYRPVRMRKGKAVRSDLWSGRYSLTPGEKPVNVSLHTTDKTAAAAKLREVVKQAERERAGIVAPRAQRDAAAASLSDLLQAYAVEQASKVSPKHAKATVARIRRTITRCGWSRLADITPASFVAFRARQTISLRARKEYQVSLNAWLNWLVRMEKIPANPLAKVDHLDVKGKGVRPARAFTDEEITALLVVAGSRRLVYLTLLYTGLRKMEVKRLVWGDVHLDCERPFVLAREGTTKSREKRAVPLHPVLAAALREEMEAYGAECASKGIPSRADAPIFEGVFPKRETLHRDFDRAGIAKRDGLGRVVHFHAFRRTFQTLGVRAGINQRAAQELLGHSDPRLTANVYTDVPSLALHDEIAKLPRFGGVAEDAQKVSETAQKRGFRAVLAELIQLAQVAIDQEKSADFSALKVVGVERLEK